MEEDRHQSAESQTPQFFKIILHDTLQSGKLGLPKSFIRTYGSGLSTNRVYLKVTSGDVWEVELYKEHGDIWLHKGWQDFVEFYHVKLGYFLVFSYQGNSEFQVLVFDKTASEIDYPVKSCNNNNTKSDGVDPCLLPVKLEIETSDSEMSVDHNAHQINANKNTNSPENRSGDDDGEIGEIATGETLNGQKAEAIPRTRYFESPNQCIRDLTQSNHVNSCIVHLPDWKTFAGDNNLMVGDVCVFELIDSVESLFQVSILRAAEDGNSSSSSVEKPHASTRNHIAKKLVFRVTITKSRIGRKHIDLPRWFAKHLNERTQDATLEVAGRFWHVSANYHRLSERATFSKGWDAFMMDNFLQVGDIC